MVPTALPEHIQEMFATRERFQFAMPPVGISVTRFQLGGTAYEFHTARCDVEGCWMVYYCSSKERAENFLAQHKSGIKFPNGERGWPACPAWPMRESLPSGLSYTEKLWNELDDVVDALSTGESYHDMTGDILKGYAQGIAFTLVMLDAGKTFMNQQQVAAHARDRRKMRLGEIPYAATPIRFRGDWTVYSNGAVVASNLADKKVTSPAPQKKTAPMTKAKGPTVADLSAATISSIRGGLASGMFTAEDLAGAYGISVELVKQVVA